ncbi:hypothetical protein [Tessaracoccus sp.]
MPEPAHRTPVPGILPTFPGYMSTCSPELALMGWTVADWDALDDPGTWDRTNINWHFHVRDWLSFPPKQFEVLVSPQQVRDALIVHGVYVREALDAYAAGASERFVTAFQRRCPVETAVTAWQRATWAGLSEPAAFGWAQAGMLAEGMDQQKAAWVAQLGPDAYLWVLAGYTLEETTAMRDAGATVSNEQLQVQAALAGSLN